MQGYSGAVYIWSVTLKQQLYSCLALFSEGPSGPQVTSSWFSFDDKIALAPIQSRHRHRRHSIFRLSSISLRHCKHRNWVLVASKEPYRSRARATHGSGHQEPIGSPTWGGRNTARILCDCVYQATNTIWPGIHVPAAYYTEMPVRDSKKSLTISRPDPRSPSIRGIEGQLV